MSPKTSNRIRFVFLAGVCLPAGIAPVARGGVPDLQLGGLDQVVRVSSQPDGTGGRGSGSVFENIFHAPTDQRFLCVITADHVVKDGVNGSIAFGNTPYGMNTGPFYKADYMALGQYKEIYVNGEFHKPDLAVMVVPVPDTPFFQTLDPLDLVEVNPEDHAFTGLGYGRTGILTQVQTAAGGNRFAYLEMENAASSYGTQRFWNNTSEGLQTDDWSLDSPYYYTALLTSIDTPGGGGILGEGMGMRGDSGGPILVEDPQPVTLANGTAVAGFTRDIEAVFTRAVTPEDMLGNRFIADFGNVYAGVALIPEYIEWAYSECYSNVPEPSTLWLLAAGVIMLRRYRSRRG